LDHGPCLSGACPELLPGIRPLLSLASGAEFTVIDLPVWLFSQ